MGTSWLAWHLEEFVKPYLGLIPTESDQKYFSAEEMTVIKNCWRSVKASAQGRKILLAGRDVFVFEVLARRENYPTIFLPECSRQTARHIKLDSKENLYIFDTGFIGSIPGALGIKSFGLLSYSSRQNVGVQIFPRLTFSRHLALKIEGTPKYWETGRMLDEAILQKQSGKEEFEKAARLTIEIYKNSVAKFVQNRRPLGGGLCH